MTARPAIGHMPFRGHRTQAEVREDEVRREILDTLGDGPCRMCGVRHSIGCEHLRRYAA